MSRLNVPQPRLNDLLEAQRVIATDIDGLLDMMMDPEIPLQYRIKATRHIKSLTQAMKDITEIASELNRAVLEHEISEVASASLN